MRKEIEAGFFNLALPSSAFSGKDFGLFDSPQHRITNENDPAIQGRTASNICKAFYFIFSIQADGQ